MSVLAVIPCLNEATHLEPLLDQMLDDSVIDVLVVADGGSDDGSIEIVQARMKDTPRLKLMHNPARIQSAGINAAVAHFGGDHQWLLRIDAHCLYPSGYVATVLAAAQTHNATAVVVPMVTKAKGGFQTAVAAAQNSALGTGGSPHRHVTSGRYVDHGHHALMSLQMFMRVGGYCEAMPCNEDAEFDHRLILAGGQIWLEPSAAIDYFPRRSLGALWRQYVRYGIGRARNVRRHGLRLKLRQALPIGVAAAAAMLPLALLHWLFALPVLTWFGLCLVAGVLVGIKAGEGWPVISGLAAATMHLAWGTGFLMEYVFAASKKSAPQHGFPRMSSQPKP